MSASLSKLVLDYLKQNAGRRSTVGEIALVVDEHPARFEAKGDKLGSRIVIIATTDPI